MSPTAGNGSSRPQTWSARLMGAFTGPGPSGGSEVKHRSRRDPPCRRAQGGHVHPGPDGGQVGARGLRPGDRRRHRHSRLLHRREQGHQGREEHPSPSHQTPSCSVASSCILCAIGFLALWKRKRTLVAFALFLVGFAFTLFVGLIGFAFILLGGWLMLRAWRINKYGTTNSKAIAREAAARPRGRQRKEAARSTSKTAAEPGLPASHRPRASATRRRHRRGRRSPKPTE